MSAFLNEAQAGCDKELIGFPHLLLCMGVVLQTKIWLYGYHFDSPNATPANAEAWLSFITRMGGNVSNGVRLYGCANWAARYGGHARQAWKTEMRSIAEKLGYHGKVSGFDTGIIDPQDGTYVEYFPEFRQRRCRIFYKRHEKMDYTNSYGVGLATPRMVSFKRDHGTGKMLPNKGNITYTTGAVIQVTPSNKGELHELNYFLRLVNFDI